ncbi:hypothetical protein [Gordonia malaquae]|uniref:hypothetical protein n=1 Tax=Gordonia malaquae TaxID=410332 RepID=UPI00301B247E
MVRRVQDDPEKGQGLMLVDALVLTGALTWLLAMGVVGSYVGSWLVSGVARLVDCAMADDEPSDD